MPLIGCNNQSPRLNEDCFDNGEANRIVHTGFVRKGTTIATTSAAAFKTDMLAAELAGNAYIIRNVNGTKAAPSIKEGKGAGLQVKRIVGKEHSITAVDIQYINNVQFWNDFENNASNFDLYYWTTNYVWKTIPTALFVAMSDPIGDDITTDIEASFTVTWSQKGNPLNYPSAAVDFVQSQQLAFANLTAGAGTNESTIAGAVLTLAGATDDVSININFTPAATTYALASGSTLPTGLTLSTAGVLGGNTVVANGTYRFSVIGTNAFGIQGQQEITLVVS